MDDEQIDKSEVEKLFGSPRRVDLFDEGDDYYNVVRPFILLQPAESFKENELPFTGVKLTPYTDFVKHQVIEDAKKQRQHIFYIKKSEKGNSDFCDAAGFYDKKKQIFIILRYSYIVSSNNYSSDDLALQMGRRKAMMTRSKADGNNRYLTENIHCVNPTVSASYVLGRKASIIEWVDDKGRSILSYYPDLAQMQANIQKPAPNVDEDKRPSISAEKKDVSDSDASVVLNTQIKKDPEKAVHRHIFYIEEQGLCKACGYYEPETNYFYIQKDSLVALFVDREYSYTNSGNARVRFIDKACVQEKTFFRVIKDAKCRSASAAACYVLGRSATYVEWIDKNGKGLKDFYPLRFFQTKEDVTISNKAVVTDPKQHLFYIKKNLGELRNCDAKGYYDPITKKFLILAGSTLSFDVVNSYRYTASDMTRRMFIKSYCENLKTCYRVKKDALVDSPSKASDYVIGRSTNGWIEWIDKNGKTLKEVYDYQ
jgi:hypothetical protein